MGILNGMTKTACGPAKINNHRVIYNIIIIIIIKKIVFASLRSYFVYSNDRNL